MADTDNTTQDTSAETPDTDAPAPVKDPAPDTEPAPAKLKPDAAEPSAKPKTFADLPKKQRDELNRRGSDTDDVDDSPTDDNGPDSGPPDSDPDVETEPDADETEGDTSPDEEAEQTGDVVLPPNISPEENTKFLAEVKENGDLSEDSYAALEEKGYPRDLVSQFVQGTIRTESEVDAFYEAAGGREFYESTLIEWANETLTPDTIREFDELLDSRSFSKATKAAKKLYDMYVEDNGVPASRRVSGYSGNRAPDKLDGIEPVRSREELRELLNSSQYQMDHSFRVKVDRRVKASKRLGIRLD